MKKIIITALTKWGSAALNRHIREAKRLSRKQRLIFKLAGFKQEVINIDPYTIELTIKNRFIDNPSYIESIITEITNALKHNAANKDQDYTIKIIEG